MSPLSYAPPLLSCAPPLPWSSSFGSLPRRQDPFRLRSKRMVLHDDLLRIRLPLLRAPDDMKQSVAANSTLVDQKLTLGHAAFLPRDLVHEGKQAHEVERLLLATD